MIDVSPDVVDDQNGCSPGQNNEYVHGVPRDMIQEKMVPIAVIDEIQCAYVDE